MCARTCQESESNSVCVSICVWQENEKSVRATGVCVCAHQESETGVGVCVCARRESESNWDVCVCVCVCVCARVHAHKQLRCVCETESNWGVWGGCTYHPQRLKTDPQVLQSGCRDQTAETFTYIYLLFKITLYEYNSILYSCNRSTISFLKRIRTIQKTLKTLLLGNVT